MFTVLLAVDAEDHNTPFAMQRCRDQLGEYWRRVTLQEDVQVTFEARASETMGGIAHWPDRSSQNCYTFNSWRCTLHKDCGGKTS